jgi:hypothetical protein
VPLTRASIEQLEGVARNPAEGSTAPRELLNLSFDREGGLVPFAGRRTDLTNLTVNDNLLAYDESSMALFDTPALWVEGASLVALPAAFATANLTLVPRGAVLAPGPTAFVRSPTGVYAAGASAPTVVAGGVTVVAGSSVVPSGAYEFRWSIETPSEAGLVVTGTGAITKNLTGAGTATEAVLVQTSTSVPAGHVVRWYFRRSEPGFMRFAVKVGDGGPMLALLSEVPAGAAFVPSEDAVVTFASGRAELHEGRTWGVAATASPFAPLLPASASERVDTYFQRPQSGLKTSDFLTAPTANRLLRSVGDVFRLPMRRLQIVRAFAGTGIGVPLVTLLDGVAPATKKLMVYLRYPPGAGETDATVGVAWTRVDGSYAGTAVATFADLPKMPHAAGSQVTLDGLTVEVEVISNAAGVGGDGSTGDLYEFDLTVIYGGVARTVRVQNTFTPFPLDHWKTGATTNVSLYQQGITSVTYLAGTWDSWSVTFDTVFARDVALATRLDLKASNYVSGATLVSGGHTWTFPGNLIGAVVAVNQPVEVGSALSVTRPEITLVYSNVGTVNRALQANTITLSPVASSRITALASSPAGLLVFMENETWLVSGNPDPYQGDARVQRLSGTMGCDPGTIPGRLGAVIFPIYKGEVYAISMGMGDVDFGSGIENLTRPLHLRDDPFVQVVGEPGENHVVALTGSGRAYRYDGSVKRWFDDPFSLAGNGPGDGSVGVNLLVTEDDDDLLLEDGGVWRTEDTPDQDRLLLLPMGAERTVYLVKNAFQTLDTSVAGEVRVRWEDVDLGDRYQHKLWRRVELATSSSYAGPPTLTYAVDGGAPAQVTGVSSGNGVWVFSLHRGVVGLAINLEFRLPGMQRGDVLEAPVHIEVAPRYRSRGRVA